MTLAASFAQLILAKRVQQKLKANPNDIESLVLLASMIKDDPVLKRSVVDRILKLEPTNKTARDMQLELDRAEMFSSPIQSVPAIPIVPAPGTGPATPIENPFIARYSIIYQILIYPAVASFLLPLIFAIPNMDARAIPGFTIFFLLLMIPIWFISAVAEVNNAGIKLSRFYGIYRREIEWKDIQTVKPNPMGVGMKLTTTEGISIRVSSQLHGYVRIVETLQRMRPDLFNMDGSRTFRKGFWAKYGWFFIVIPLTLLTPGALIAPPFLPGIIIAVITYIFWKSILHSPHTIMVEENRLVAQSFRDKVEMTAQQIKKISIFTVRNRRGVAKNLIKIEYNEEDEFAFTGFPEGNEIMLGLLRNWWLEHKTGSA